MKTYGCDAEWNGNRSVKSVYLYRLWVRTPPHPPERSCNRVTLSKYLAPFFDNLTFDIYNVGSRVTIPRGSAVICYAMCIRNTLNTLGPLCYDNWLHGSPLFWPHRLAARTTAFRAVKRRFESVWGH